MNNAFADNWAKFLPAGSAPRVSFRMANFVKSIIIFTDLYYQVDLLEVEAPNRQRSSQVLERG